MRNIKSRDPAVATSTMCVVFLFLVSCASNVPGPAAEPKQTVLFLCPYGGAKSVIAASYFNHEAASRGLPLQGSAAATEEPYAAVPPKVAALLEREGIDVSDLRPRRVTAADFEGAGRVVSIDCDLTAVDTRGATVEQWSDVPKVSVDIDASARAIRRHVEALVDELARARR